METEIQTGCYNWYLCTWYDFPENWKEVLTTMVNADGGRGQLETCPETKRVHVQFVLYYKNGIGVKTGLAYFAPYRREGTSLKLIGCKACDKAKILNYVKKQETAHVETRFEFGKIRGYWDADEPKKYEDAIANAKKGMWQDTAADLQVKYIGNLLKLEALYGVPHESESCRGVWIYGPPGSGKSHYARHHYPKAFSKAQSKWWDGYTGQRNVVLDDLDSNCLGHLLKIWADRYGCYGEVKGATVPLRHEKFIVTSNYLPRDLWEQPTLLQAIRRRFIFIRLEDRNITFQGDYGNEPPADSSLDKSSYLEGLGGWLLQP